ncbi:MAG: PilN domain-containing protein [Candidatus Omnitrophota bacterium]
MNMTLVLEIGNPWLKMAIFRSALNVHHLRALSAVTVADPSEEAQARALTDFLKDLKIKKPKNTVVSFSRNAVTLRNLRIPSVVPAEIDDMIKLHVGRQVPYAKEEIVSGYRVIGRDAMGYSKVMLAIVHRESIRRIFRILEKVGLYTDAVELSSDGILSWLGKATKGFDVKPAEAFIILDVDAAFTDFIVSTTENILFSRVITLGRDQLNEESRWAKFIGEMKQAIVISQSEEVLQKPVRIFLGGAVEHLQGLSTRLELEFNLPATVVAPLANAPVAKDLVKFPANILESVSMGALLGVGLDAGRKRINFTLPEAQIRKTLQERSRDIMFFGSIAMYLMLAACGVYLEKLRNKEATLGILRDRYQKSATQAEGLSEKVERIRKIKSKRDTKSAAINYLFEISKLLPPRVVVVSLSFQQDDRVNVKGRTNSLDDVVKLRTTLEASPYFKDVQTNYARQKKVKDKEFIEFELICPKEQEKSRKKK